MALEPSLERAARIWFATNSPHTRAAVFQSVTTSPLAGMLDARFIAPMQTIKIKRLKKAFIGHSPFDEQRRLYALANFCVKLIASHSLQARRLMRQPIRFSSVLSLLRC